MRALACALEAAADTLRRKTLPPPFSASHKCPDPERTHPASVSSMRVSDLGTTIHRERTQECKVADRLLEARFTLGSSLSSQHTTWICIPSRT